MGWWPLPPHFGSETSFGGESPFWGWTPFGVSSHWEIGKYLGVRHHLKGVALFRVGPQLGVGNYLQWENIAVWELILRRDPIWSGALSLAWAPLREPPYIGMGIHFKVVPHSVLGPHLWCRAPFVW